MSPLGVSHLSQLSSKEDMIMKGEHSSEWLFRSLPARQTMMYNKNAMAKGWCVWCATILSVNVQRTQTNIMKPCIGDEDKNMHWPNCISFIAVVCVKVSAPYSGMFQQRPSITHLWGRLPQINMQLYLLCKLGRDIEATSQRQHRDRAVGRWRHLLEKCGLNRKWKK